jgi:hypothetical protein
MLSRLGWLLIAMKFSCLLQASSIVVLIKHYEFSSSYRSLMVVMLVFGLLVFLMATFIFLSRGGAKYQSYYLSFTSFVLYVHAILCLYSSGATIYFMAAKPQNAGDHLALVRAFGILFAIVSVFFIYITTQIPHLVSFLREFRRYAKSEKIFLPRFICTCLSPPVEEPKKVFRRVSAVAVETEPLVVSQQAAAVDVEKGELISPKVDSEKPAKKRRFFFGA